MLLIISYIFNRFFKKKKKEKCNITCIHLCFTTPKCRKTCLQTKKYWLYRTKEALIKMKPFSKDTTFKHTCLNSAAKFHQEKDTDYLLRLTEGSFRKKHILLVKEMLNKRMSAYLILLKLFKGP